MLLIPPHITWLARIISMFALISLYTIATYVLDLWTTKYYHSFHFNFLETLTVGLTGLSVIEDIYFIGMNTHLFMLTLTLLLHATLTILSLLLIVTITGICINLYFNTSANEAFGKGDFTTFSLFVFDALVKTMAIFTIISCIWFNVTILPIDNVYIATTASIILTATFSYAYFFLDKAFSFINYRGDSLSIDPYTSPKTPSKQLTKGKRLNKKNSHSDNTGVSNGNDTNSEKKLN